MIQVQVRVPEESVQVVDNWVKQGKFKSRSDSMKTILAFYMEREKTREFYNMLMQRSNEAREKPDILIPLED